MEQRLTPTRLHCRLLRKLLQQLALVAQQPLPLLTQLLLLLLVQRQLPLLEQQRLLRLLVQDQLPLLEQQRVPVLLQAQQWQMALANHPLAML